jgi:CubicO group peptidase (beta-lactamase class C family)
MDLETVFDVGSLTAGVVTTTLIGQLLDSGRLRLEERISRYVPGFGILGKSQMTIGDVLSHTAGLPGWHPYFDDVFRARRATGSPPSFKGTREFIQTAIVRSACRTGGEAKYVFSDIGLLVLGYVIEAQFGMPLDRVAATAIFRPAKMKSSAFIDLEKIKMDGVVTATPAIAPTEVCPWRKRLLWGEVHDDNAWVMGGVAPHSGLFSTAGDLVRFGSEMLAAFAGRGSLLSQATLHRFWGGRVLSSGGCIRYGWDLPSRENGMIQAGVADSAFGYNGFTGCSLWIDPIGDTVAVLLSNRVNPTRANKKFPAAREKIFQAMRDAFAE